MKIVLVLACFLLATSLVSAGSQSFSNPPSHENFMVDTEFYHIEREYLSVHIFARRADHSIVESVSVMLGVAGAAEFTFDNDTAVNCPRDWNHPDPLFINCDFNLVKFWNFSNPDQCNTTHVPTTVVFDVVKNATRSRGLLRVECAPAGGPNLDFIVDVYDKEINSVFAGQPLYIPHGGLEVSIPVTKWEYQPETTHIALSVNNTFYWNYAYDFPLYGDGNTKVETDIGPDGRNTTTFVHNNITFPDQVTFILTLADFALLDGEFVGSFNHTTWNFTQGVDAAAGQFWYGSAQFIVFPKFEETFMYDPTLSFILLGDNVIKSPDQPPTSSSTPIVRIVAPVVVLGVILIAGVIAALYWKVKVQPLHRKVPTKRTSSHNPGASQSAPIRPV